ncbi:MAG: glutathione S-transferase [Maricaulis sp.]|jgi:glutathione S-transferase|nr:glutathione S-transferase [Maricaulis sp.]
MKLYDYAKAPNPRRARMVFAEKRVDVERIEIDLGAKAQFEDAFRSINPRCTVPALELDDGTLLTENSSIVRFMEETYPEPPLLGRTPLEKALVAEWTTRVEWEGLMGVAEALRNTSRFFKDAAITGTQPYPQLPELAERGRHRAEAFFAVLDARLADSAYLAGGQFSAADIVGFVFIDFSAWIKLRPNSDLVHLAAWYDAIAARPSASA